MDEEELERLYAMAFITRARVDVLESAFSTALALGDETIAQRVEEGLRTQGELHANAPDDKVRACAQASVRLAEVVASSLGARRSAGRPPR